MLDAVVHRLYVSKYHVHNVLVKNHSKNLIKWLVVEGALNWLLMRPCSAHFRQEGPNYLPFLTYSSRRPVVSNIDFLLVKELAVTESLRKWLSS